MYSTLYVCMYSTLYMYMYSTLYVCMCTIMYFTFVTCCVPPTSRWSRGLHVEGQTMQCMRGTAQELGLHCSYIVRFEYNRLFSESGTDYSFMYRRVKHGVTSGEPCHCFTRSNSDSVLLNRHTARLCRASKAVMHVLIDWIAHAIRIPMESEHAMFQYGLDLKVSFLLHMGEDFTFYQELLITEQTCIHTVGLNNFFHELVAHIISTYLPLLDRCKSIY